MPSINLLKGVNAYLTDKAKNNDRDYTYFHASSWDFCRARDDDDPQGMYKYHRQVAYSYYEALGLITLAEGVVKPNGQLERIFDNGHYAHDRWRVYLERAGKGALWGRWVCQNPIHIKPKIYGLDKKLGCVRPDKCECGKSDFQYMEVGFRDEETTWGGHVDAVIDARRWPYAKNVDRDAKDPDLRLVMVIVDFKTINPFGFKKLEAPKPEHITQMQIYLSLSGLQSGKFIYENKADQSVKEYVVERDDEFINIKRQEAVFMRDLVAGVNTSGKKVLPKRGFDEEDKDNKTCMQCKYRSHCWPATGKR